MLHQGELDEALTLAERSLEYAIDQGLKEDECAARRVLGMIHCARGDLERAEEYLSQSMDQACELDNRYQIGQSMRQVGLLRREQRLPDQARVTLLEAKAIFEELDASVDLAEVEKELELTEGNQGGVS